MNAPNNDLRVSAFIDLQIVEYNGFPNEQKDAEPFDFSQSGRGHFNTIARVIHICCHNGWHLPIMSIISLFNAFNRVADRKQMVNLQAYSKHNTFHIIELSSRWRAAVS